MYRPPATVRKLPPKPGSNNTPTGALVSPAKNSEADSPTKEKKPKPSTSDIENPVKVTQNQIEASPGKEGKTKQSDQPRKTSPSPVRERPPKPTSPTVSRYYSSSFSSSSSSPTKTPEKKLEKRSSSRLEKRSSSSQSQSGQSKRSLISSPIKSKAASGSPQSTSGPSPSPSRRQLWIEASYGSSRSASMRSASESPSRPDEQTKQARQEQRTHINYDTEKAKQKPERKFKKRRLFIFQLLRNKDRTS